MIIFLIVGKTAIYKLIDGLKYCISASISFLIFGTNLRLHTVRVVALQWFPVVII